MNIDIGSKIKTLRLSKSMTQEQLAKALHVSAQAVPCLQKDDFRQKIGACYHR